MNVSKTGSRAAGASRQPDSYHEHSAENKWQTVRTALQRQHTQVIDEIREYPFPIPACDAQYNYLLEQRTELFRALKAIDRLAEHDTVGIQNFVKVSPFLCYETLFNS